MENDVNDVEELTSTTNFSFDNLYKYPWKQITYLNNQQNNSLLEKFECLNKIIFFIYFII